MATFVNGPNWLFISCHITWSQKHEKINLLRKTNVVIEWDKKNRSTPACRSAAEWISPDVQQICKSEFVFNSISSQYRIGGQCIIDPLHFIVVPNCTANGRWKTYVFFSCLVFALRHDPNYDCHAMFHSSMGTWGKEKLEQTSTISLHTTLHYSLKSTHYTTH